MTLYTLIVPLHCAPFQLKAAELQIPQQVEERRPETHPPDGGGRADSGPVDGVGSLVQQPVEEHGRPAQGDVQRGPGQGMYTRHNKHVCASWCSGPWLLCALYT